MLMELSTWSRVEKSMQDKITVQKLTVNPLNGWSNSDIWEHPKQIRIAFAKKLRAG
jgi:hypothetical protein